MANRNMNHPWVLGDETVIVVGSFAPNGSSAISASSRKGRGWSVAYTSTGLYTVTFSNKYYDFITAIPTLQIVTASDQRLELGTWTASTKALQIRNWDISAAALADIAADAANRIGFVAYFQNKSTPPLRG